MTYSWTETGGITLKFKNKIVVVTGAGQGIGACISRAYAKQGAVVMMIDIDEEALTENGKYMDEQGYTAMQFVGDVSKHDEMKKIFDVIANEYNRIDILVNNAAIMDDLTLQNRDLEQWNKVIGINLSGPYLCSQLATPLMMEGGSIVNLCSTRATMSEPHTEAYSASKGGLLALTHSLAVSLGPRIRVNAISPGWIDVSQWKKMKDRKFTHISEADHTQHPAGRVGIPEDVANTCLFLTGEEAGFITGSNFVVDGGMTIKMIYE